MTYQKQNMGTSQTGESQPQESQPQWVQTEPDAVSFLNSYENQNTICNTILRLFSQAASTAVDWDWAHRLLEQKQLPEIRQRLRDTLGRNWSLLAAEADELSEWGDQPDWLFQSRPPLEANRLLWLRGETQGRPDLNPLLIETFGRDEIKGKLLISGASGAGKTTALLSLAEQLVVGAMQQPQRVIPVLFELSAWRHNNQGLQDWLIEQLYTWHGGDRGVHRYEQWLDQQVLLPLLDGLDELELEQQQQCISELNEFAGQYPYLVVCSGMRDCAQINISFHHLQGAVGLEPLSDQQIRAYLNQQRSPLWAVIQSSPDRSILLAPTVADAPGLLRTPLFLSLTAHLDRPYPTPAELLEQYVDWQLSPEGRERDRWNAEGKRAWVYEKWELEPDWRQTQQTLRWLARQLQRTNSVELLIEQIQPSWLETKRLRRGYSLLFGLMVGLSVGLSVGLVFGLIFGLSLGLRTGLSIGLLFGLIFGTISGASVGLNIGLSAGADQIQPAMSFRISPPQSLGAAVFASLKRWFIGLLVIGIIAGLGHGVLFGLMGGLMGGLTSGLLFGLTSALGVGLSIVLGTWFSLGIQQDLQLRSQPNQGIWNSLNSFFSTTLLSYPLGIVFAGISVLPTIVAQSISQEVNGWMLLRPLLASFPQFLVPGLLVALILGLEVGGGRACMQHVCLRFVLWRSGVVPWNLSRFLNYCVERRLLRRVGGRYRFLHPELQAHFAQRGVA